MTSRMTATDELRRMLDERGVEWWAEDDPEDPAYYFVTKWFANGCEQAYEEIPAIRSRSLNAYCVTPEQAIEATLGSDLKAENAELRDDLQRANDAVCDAEHEESRAWDRVRKVEAENDKLRKLLADFRDAMWGGGEWTEPFDDRMRELGVEV